MKGKDELKGIYTVENRLTPGFNRTGDGGDCLQAVGRTWEWAHVLIKQNSFA